jgi:hypothetical protein
MQVPFMRRRHLNVGASIDGNVYGVVGPVGPVVLHDAAVFANSFTRA